jgi:hypothetical protein
MRLTSCAGAVYVIACDMIEGDGDQGNVLERFVRGKSNPRGYRGEGAVGRCQGGREVLTSEVARLLTVSSSKSRVSGSSATSGC